MRIDRNLNLVFEVEREDGVKLFVHSAPISTDVFDLFWEPISLVFSRIMQRGHNITSGPRIADKMLKKVAQELGQWEGPGGVEHGLLPEMRRLTNVLVPGVRGWEVYPLDDAKTRGVIEKTDAIEVEARVTFFTVLLRMMSKEERKSGLLDIAAEVSGAQIVSFNCTEYLNSLPTLNKAGNSGVAAAA